MVFSEGCILNLTHIVMISSVVNLWCPGRNTVLSSGHFEDGRQQVPIKCCFLSTRLYGVTFHNTVYSTYLLL